ncbi:antileukoproteinase-like [Heteronotia binoei]|uniref:antileukoproteinase-like n=1 Tax=Heteronotia binoei TaxID=13085 RepID=UPI00292E0522|nr:antileukoproteinase-like [Heteronotia binoei]
MKTLSAFLLVWLLALWIELPSASCNQEKPGICPPDPFRCIQTESPLCRNDFCCLGEKKCCYYQCRFRLPAQFSLELHLDLVPDSNMKTLSAILIVGFLVLWTEMQPTSAISVPYAGEKPGRCPIPPGRCRMIDPPNDCDYDFECFGPMKCCLMICGRACVNPV